MRHRRWPFGILTRLLAVCALPLEFRAADWPKWRGPNGDGISPEAGHLRTWAAAGPQVLWQSEVHTGVSGLAVSGGRLYTVGNLANEDQVQCLETATGRTVWIHRYPAPLGPDQYEGGPGATPIVDGRQVFTLGKWGDLFCLDAATGRVIWGRRLATDFSLSLPEWGLSGSPLVLGDRLYLNAGGRGMALDKRNGTLVWSNIEGPNGYSACIAYNHAGIPAVAFLGHREAVGVARSDGEVLLAMLWRTPFDRNFPDPIPFEDGLLICGAQLTAIYVGVEDRGSSIRWQAQALQPSRSPGVILNGHVYSFSGDPDVPGKFLCVKMEDGSVRWKHEGIVPGSVIGVGGRLLVLDGFGAVRIVAADANAYRELSRAQILPQSRTWTPPSYANGVAYLRNSKGRLAAISLPLLPPSTLGVRTINESVEVTWTTVTTNAVLEQTQPNSSSGRPLWEAVPRTSGTWTTNSYRALPSASAALYRLRIPE
ncbi:MAG: PQQ-binding-like beta-propeller repeat protein [Verrucomicrobiales bacterium]|nr:PQQ-binding-like beta-propeller repeat protein [Verrucomicrobiales bacterium]